MEKINLVICGACGKMGNIITELALKDSDFFVKGGVERKGHPLIGKEAKPGVKIFENLEDIVEKNDVVIDFSMPEATMEFLKVVESKKCRFVIGTTGFSKEQIIKIKEISNNIPVFISPNMSLGVNFFFEIIKYATKLLKNYEIEIVEVHHHFKKDSPSGTAKKIVELISKERNIDVEKVVRYGRIGFLEERKKEEIGIHSLRIGDIVGEHSVFFGGIGEIIELTHRCYNREAFASGALKVAKYICKKEKGLYGMEDYIKEEVINV
ncbi:MAG: 4-hydroxy-tetrahydrodipicolinate reductase [bacterium]|nr:4-hydroxy-tetrahydrodipicolinate reductase [bacterium]MDW8164479.1 4-hydroxy-tetrahydrodipicolinate reductase [Candidatus Omnitrophota bacterium]